MSETAISDAENKSLIRQVKKSEILDNYTRNNQAEMAVSIVSTSSFRNCYYIVNQSYKTLSTVL
ncbi:hypothetical protein E2C01_078778 [Portunus trituberculatus]|uniref:Uncharacterized protein n=1 Tax=Portunus trituberculatus TaxID=210409 RepID=A0A5B7INR7_PORTR|nr:hypothetical protein [Portunus trituberculatus]